MKKPFFYAALCFFWLSFPAFADEIQEINRLMKQGQSAQALERVNAYLAQKPKDAHGRFIKGVILTEQNRQAEAIKVFTSLTEDYPELPEPYNNLAVLYAAQGQYEKAKNSLEMAIRTHPSYATAHENLGDIYAKMASQAYDKALQLDKSNAKVQTKLELIKDLFGGSHVAPKKVEARPEPKIELPKAEAKAEAKSEPKAAAKSESKPEAKLEPKKTPDEADAVLKTLNKWADAWSKKDVEGYLSCYAPSFKTPDGESLNQWKASRRDRIRKPKSIDVTVSDAMVSFSDPNHALVHFRQGYRSSSIKSSTRKIIGMVRHNAGWLIESEKIGH